MADKKEQAITEKTCNRCGASWWPKRPGVPLACPRCKSPLWNRERVYTLKAKAPARSRADDATPAPAVTDPAPVSLAGGVRAASVLESYRSLKQGE